MSLPGLTAVSLPHLRELLRAVESNALACPLQPTELQANGLGALASALHSLEGLTRPAMLAVLTAVVAEREHRPVPRLDLVWTGDEASNSEALDTELVVQRLFAEARETVLVSSYGFRKSRKLFEPLCEAIRSRGVTATLFFGFQGARKPTSKAEVDAFVEASVEGFFEENWDALTPRPIVYYDRGTALEWRHLHAKCVVVDRRKSLITSANLTQQGQTRNVELGVLVEDPEFASRLVGQWNGLVREELVERYLGRGG